MSLKKSLGINRNRLQNLNQAKVQLHKKKNRFKYINTQDQQSITHNEINSSNNNDQLLSETTRNSSSSQKSYEYHVTCVQICQQIKQMLNKVTQIKTKMAYQAKCRYSSFKQSQTQKRDQNICKFSKQAVNYILKCQRNLNTVRNIRGKTLMEQKYYRNMQMSLAQQIRQASKGLRNQQKQYFQRLKTYQKGTMNNAIQLNTQDRQKMRGDQLFLQQQQKLDQDQQQNMRINQLVKSINQLTTVYRQLNQLVIHQGSLIDRIDFNIQETFMHVQKGNQHLKSADQKAHNKYAAKCIYGLMTAILILAVILGFKYSASGK